MLTAKQETEINSEFNKMQNIWQISKLMNTEACNLHLQTKTATQYLGHRRKCSFLLIFNCRCIRSRHDSRYFSCCVLYSFIMSTNLVRSVPCYYTSYRKKLFTV